MKKFISSSLDGGSDILNQFRIISLLRIAYYVKLGFILTSYSRLIILLTISSVCRVQSALCESQFWNKYLLFIKLLFIYLKIQQMGFFGGNVFYIAVIKI